MKVASSQIPGTQSSAPDRAVQTPTSRAAERAFIPAAGNTDVILEHMEEGRRRSSELERAPTTAPRVQRAFSVEVLGPDGRRTRVFRTDPNHPDLQNPAPPYSPSYLDPVLWTTLASGGIVGTAVGASLLAAPPWSVAMGFSFSGAVMIWGLTGFLRECSLQRMYRGSDETLESHLQSFLREAGATLPDERWHLDRSIEAGHFGVWLGKVARNADARSPAQREALFARVLGILAELNDTALRAEIFGIAREAALSCSDRASLGLNAMEMACANARAARGTLSQGVLFHTGLSMFRMHALETWVREHHPLSGEGAVKDPVEVLLGYQVALRDRLDLPVGTREMAYAHCIPPAQFAAAAQHIESMQNSGTRIALRRYELQRDALEATPLAVLRLPELHPAAQFLAEHYTPWREHIARTRKRDIRALKALSRDYLARLDEVQQANPAAMSDGTYTRAADAAHFFHEHGVAYHAALQQLQRERPTPSRLPAQR